MYLFGCGVQKQYTDNSIKAITDKITPFLSHGSILLTSTFQNQLSLISPSGIKHASVCSIEDNNIFIIETSGPGKMKKSTLSDFLQRRESILIFDYYDKEAMTGSMKFIERYRETPYGFFGDSIYCYELIFNIYRDYYLQEKKKHIEKKSDFFPIIRFFNREYINSYSIMKSKKFIPLCMMINDKFIIFKQSNRC